MNAAEIDLRREENRRKALEKYGPPWSVLAHRLLDAWLSWSGSDDDEDAPHVIRSTGDERLVFDPEEHLATLFIGETQQVDWYKPEKLAHLLGGARPPPVKYASSIDAQEHQRLLDIDERLKAYYATRDEMDAIDKARKQHSCTRAPQDDPLPFGGDPCWKATPKNTDEWCKGCVERQRLTARLNKLQKSCAGLTKRMRLLVTP